MPPKNLSKGAIGNEMGPCKMHISIYGSIIKYLWLAFFGFFLPF